jgi:hemerythrin-like domain-containing protein
MIECTSPTQVLKDEHQVILKVLDVLELLLERADQSGELDHHGLERCLTFFKLFADACHHGKEEEVLFPELVIAGLPRHGGPIDVMLYEHQQGRELVKQMSTALEAVRPTNDDNWRKGLVRAGRCYIDLLRRHIGKEDHCLFAIADQVLDEHGCGRVCGGYHEACHRKLDGYSHKELEALADQLQVQYIPESALQNRCSTALPPPTAGCCAFGQPEAH